MKCMIESIAFVSIGCLVEVKEAGESGSPFSVIVYCDLWGSNFKRETCLQKTLDRHRNCKQHPPKKFGSVSSRLFVVPFQVICMLIPANAQAY